MSKRIERSLVFWCGLAAFLATACDRREPAEPTAEPAELPAFAIVEPAPFQSVPALAAGDQALAGIVGVYRLPNDDVVIADADGRLQWFDSAGSVRRSVDAAVSASGADPALTWMRGYRGDSLIVFDAASDQFSVLDARGAVAQLVAHDAAGRPLGRLGTALRHPCGAAVEVCAAELSPFSGVWTASANGVYVARPDRTELQLITADSAVVLDGAAGWERSAGSEVPTYARLIADSEGYLWAQSGDLSRAAVFGPDGELQGAVRLPPDFQIRQVGGDFILGVTRDAEGTEHVKVFRLQRTQTAAHKI